jgi:transposase InsO family protein
MSHANARLTFHGRLLLVRRVRRDGRPAAHVARELGISRQCAYRWVRRFDAEGLAGLADRSSRPHRMPRKTPAPAEAAVIAARRQLRQGPAFLAGATGVPARTISRILARAGEPPLAACDPLTGEVIRASKHTAVRYQRDRPGELIHVDVKKIGRIPDGGGWRATGRPGSRTRAAKNARTGYDYVHAAVDDCSRLAYAEVLPDEKGSTAAGFLARAAARFAAAGIPAIDRVMTDNALAYRRSTAFAAAVDDLGARQKFTRPHCPWQNGKVERFNRTLQVEWAYRQPFRSNEERAEALEPWLIDYNCRRRHSALGGQPPVSRLSPT